VKAMNELFDRALKSLDGTSSAKVYQILRKCGWNEDDGGFVERPKLTTLFDALKEKGARGDQSAEGTGPRRLEHREVRGPFPLKRARAATEGA